MPKFTIGLCVVDNWIDAWHTIQSLRLFHVLPDALDSELLIIDNRPGEHGQSVMLRRFCEGWSSPESPIQYVAMTSPTGTSQPRNRIFAEANGEIVLCMDSHVHVWPGAIKRLVEWFDAQQPGTPEAKALVQGPVLWDHCKVGSTHFRPEWGTDCMWGQWDLDPRGNDIDGEGFDIPGMGLGLFACRRDAWQGFHPDARGFGGEELCYHEKHRRAGGRTLCLPSLRWAHRFTDPNYEKPGYALTLEDKAANYVLWFNSLGWDLEPVRKAFVGQGKLTPAGWDWIVADPVNHRGGVGIHTGTTSTATLPGGLLIHQDQPTISGAPTGTKAPPSWLTPAQQTSTGPMMPLDAGQPPRLTGTRLQRLMAVEHNLARLVNSGAAYTEVVRQCAHDDATKPIDPLPPVDSVFIEIIPPSCATLARLVDTYQHSAQKFIGIWDTGQPVETGPDGVGVGLGAVVFDFCRTHPEWRFAFHTSADNGLVVIGKGLPEPAKIEDPGFGPGTELKGLLEAIGVKSDPSCDCNARAAQMNVWGPDECRKRREEIVGWLREGQDRWGWTAKLRAAAQAVTSGVAIHLSLSDPLGSLVDRAIELAERQNKLTDSG